MLVLVVLLVSPIVALSLEDSGTRTDPIACDELRLKSETWPMYREIHEKSRAWSDRRRTGDAIAHCGALIGKTRDGVVDLLGRPDTRGKRSFLYLLGADALGDEINLVVTFAPNVTRAEVV